MMTKTNTPKNRIFRLLFIIPAIALALTLNIKCASKNNIPSDKQIVEITQVKPGTLDKTIKEKQVFVIVEDMPQFPGGDLALQTWIAENVKYPAVAQKNKKEGRVYIGFVVNEDGSVDRVKVMRGASPSLDAEALRVVSAMPKWTPGKQRGENVCVSYTVPINFALK